MKRSIHTFVSLLAVVLLARPFDCFATSTPSHEEMECCLKAQCGPMAKDAECCKNTVPDDQLVILKAADHSAPLAVVATTSISTLVPPLPVQRAVEPLRHPPPPVGLVSRNLPLLI